mgnify:FL=1|tara:strand:+ start:53 stop:1762 length:1710 start_codon:yes stop_codon:yes gene_type:complete
MKKFIIILSVLLLGCSNNDSLKLEKIIQEFETNVSYDSKEFPIGVYTKEYYKSESDYAKEKLNELNYIDQTSLTDNEQISYELLKFVLNEKVDFYKYERFLNPLLSDSGFHINLGFFVRPITNYNQAKNYLDKLNAIPKFVDQNIENLREGLEKGVSQPLVIFKGYESSYNMHITNSFINNFFYSPFKNLPKSINNERKDSIVNEGKLAVEKIVIPQFKRIKKFFEDEYYPQTRTTIGVSNIPKGRDFYQNRINYYTTSEEYTSEEIHQIGLNEVSRIKSEMFDIIESLNFEGSFSDFLNFLRTDKQFYAKSAEELLMRARDIAKRADEQLPKFFKTLPRKPYGVAPVPESIAPKYTAGRYVGTSKNSTNPGYYWVNTYNLSSRTLYTLPSLTVHEAVPGHHLQGSLNNELGDSIPSFRKNLYLSAYGEGWGLYTEFLANDMGLYTSPYEEFGKLTYEMWRACRLVVDTGLHSKGWSKEEAIEYMASNTALSLHEINTETDRYISWPGQALSYKIGELKIRSLREKAQNALGEQFDIRDFHEVILGQGTVTLSILEKRINKYIEENKTF